MLYLLTGGCIYASTLIALYTCGLVSSAYGLCLLRYGTRNRAYHSSLHHGPRHNKPPAHTMAVLLKSGSMAVLFKSEILRACSLPCSLLRHCR